MSTVEGGGGGLPISFCLPMGLTLIVKKLLHQNQILFFKSKHHFEVTIGVFLVKMADKNIKYIHTPRKSTLSTHNLQFCTTI